uniref:Uncharacterized protein n=1 Tax=Timema douglasi TaxID=61478 RepID=A0A7R8VTG9_TIMDO|nr:unnamed protein product [Timema douglasi]
MGKNSRGTVTSSRGKLAKHLNDRQKSHRDRHAPVSVIQSAHNREQCAEIKRNSLLKTEPGSRCHPTESEDTIAHESAKPQTDPSGDTLTPFFTGIILNYNTYSLSLMSILQSAIDVVFYCCTYAQGGGRKAGLPGRESTVALAVPALALRIYKTGSQFQGTDPFYSAERRRRNLCTTCNEDERHSWSLGRQIHHLSDNHGVWVVRSNTSLARTSRLGPKDKSGSSDLGSQVLAAFYVSL